jgi:hypothetical protein
MSKLVIISSSALIGMLASSLSFAAAGGNGGGNGGRNSTPAGITLIDKAGTTIGTLLGANSAVIPLSGTFSISKISVFGFLWNAGDYREYFPTGDCSGTTAYMPTDSLPGVAFFIPDVGWPSANSDSPTGISPAGTFYFSVAPPQPVSVTIGAYQTYGIKVAGGAYQLICTPIPARPVYGYWGQVQTAHVSYTAPFSLK